MTAQMKSDNNHSLVLVSDSPRRRQLLSERNFRLELASPPDNIIELSSGEPEFVVTENARLKVQGYVNLIGLTEKFNKVYLGVDTIVVSDGKVLGKPEDFESARKMLRSLSGRSHGVFTALHLVDGTTGNEMSRLCKTTVVFRELSDGLIDRYVESQDPMDKAGAYGIQSFAGLFIESIDGCYYNVVGLPLSCLCQSLNKLGYDEISFMV